MDETVTETFQKWKIYCTIYYIRTICTICTIRNICTNCTICTIRTNFRFCTISTTGTNRTNCAFSTRMPNSIVVHVCAINFFYVFIVPRPILRHLGEFGNIRLLLGENTRFLPEGGGVSMGISKTGYDRFTFFFGLECNKL